MEPCSSRAQKLRLQNITAQGGQVATWESHLIQEAVQPFPTLALVKGWVATDQV